MEEVSSSHTIRYNGTIRTPYKSEFKECFRCKQTKDVIEFTAFYYQKKKDGIKIGDPIRKRLGHCKSCALKKGESIINKSDQSSHSDVSSVGSKVSSGVNVDEMR